MRTPVHQAWADWTINNNDYHFIITTSLWKHHEVFLSSRAMTQDQIKHMRDRVSVLRRFL